MSRLVCIHDSSNGHNGEDRVAAWRNGQQPIETPAEILSLTSEQVEEIEACNIRVFNQGKFSEDIMSRAVVRLMPLLTRTDCCGKDDGNSSEREEEQEYHEQFIVNEGQMDGFYKREGRLATVPSYEIGKIDQDDSGTSSIGGRRKSGGPSEEAILLEIEVLRRSSRKVKRNLFTSNGGRVVFGPWWNYALGRVLELHSSGAVSSATDEMTLKEFTVVKILFALFSLLREDLSDVVRPGHVTSLNLVFGVDWIQCVKNAKMVVNYCGWECLKREVDLMGTHLQALLGVQGNTGGATIKIRTEKSKSSPHISKNKPTKRRRIAMTKVENLVELPDDTCIHCGLSTKNIPCALCSGIDCPLHFLEKVQLGEAPI